jgi:hypothetical protein
VGHAEADRISKDATDRGELVHAFVEWMYRCDLDGDAARTIEALGATSIRLSNRFGPTGVQMARDLYRASKRGCPASDVWCQETALWSASRRYAGRVDMVGLWHGVPSIVDYKTSTKPKREEWITDYYLQTAAYALAHDELFGSDIQQVVILITCATGELQTFMSDVRPWVSQLEDRLSAFYALPAAA